MPAKTRAFLDMMEAMFCSEVTTAPPLETKAAVKEVAAVYKKIAGWFDQTRTRALIELPYLDHLAGR